MYTLSIVFKEESDGRWIAEIEDIPGAMAYGSTTQGYGLKTCRIMDGNMSRHPSNKHERMDIKRRKGRERALRYDNELRPDVINFLGDTGTPCSCWICGNPRRYYEGKAGLTIQERKAMCHQPNTRKNNF